MMKQINRDDALFIIITGNSRESLRAKCIGCSATAHIFDCFKIVKINFRQVIPCVCPFWNKIDYIQYALFIKNKWNTRDSVNGTWPTICGMPPWSWTRLTATAWVLCGLSGLCCVKIHMYEINSFINTVTPNSQRTKGFFITNVLFSTFDIVS